MRKRITTILCLTAFAASGWAAQLQIITTTPDFADIARRLAGDRASVEALAKGFQNPHFVEAKPSLIVKLMKADMFIQTGLELESGWAPLLLQGSRNRRVMPGGSGFIDASTAITPREVPANVSRSEGDVHPQGNPHYMADPENAAPVARLIADRLIALDPSGKSAYEANLKAFNEDLAKRLPAWTAAMAPLHGAPYVSYHRDWNYFAHRYGLVSVGEIEPKPGIPPTASHTAELIGTMKAGKVRFILTDPWFEARTGEFLAKETGARILLLCLYPGGAADAATYLEAVDHNIRMFTGGSAK